MAHQKAHRGRKRRTEAEPAPAKGSPTSRPALRLLVGIGLAIVAVVVTALVLSPAGQGTSGSEGSAGTEPTADRAGRSVAPDGASEGAAPAPAAPSEASREAGALAATSGGPQPPPPAAASADGVRGAGALSETGNAPQTAASLATSAAPPDRFRARVVNAFPHDPKAFTQGLVYRDGFLYESTGLHGESSVRKVRIETGEVVRQIRVDAAYFAEGLADWKNQLVQLTWQSQVGFVYDLKSLALKRRFTYAGEGWGLARDASRLVMSDGSATLRFLDPETFAETGRMPVTDRGRPVVNLNELEVVRGQLYANVWMSDEIVIVDLTTGRVAGRADLGGLLTPRERAAGVDVLNGIAYDAERDRLFVTGKWWPRLFEIRLDPVR